MAQSSSSTTAVASRLVERSLHRQREKSQREVTELLRAAERVLARRGYAGLRVDDVLAEAGLSTRAFYRHFRGRSELFLALFDHESARAMERLAEAGLSTRAFYRHFRGRSELFLALFDHESARAMERLAGKVESHADPEDRVRGWIEANLALAFDARLASRTRLFLLERAEMAREFRDEVRRCVRSVLAPLEQAIADGRDAGQFPAADPSRDALAIHHLCAGLLQDELLGLGELGRSDALALATRFALGTLRGPTAPAHPPVRAAAQRRSRPASTTSKGKT